VALAARLPGAIIGVSPRQAEAIAIDIFLYGPATRPKTARWRGDPECWERGLVNDISTQGQGIEVRQLNRPIPGSRKPSASG
jgi:hypothetical protein